MTRVLPTGWEEKTLGEVCEINIGKTPSRADVSYWDKKKETNNIWLSIADLSNTTDKKVYSSKEFLSNKGAKIVPIVERGTLLLSFKLTIGRVAFAGVPLRTNEAIAQLPIKNANTLDKNYLYYYLQAYDYEELLQGDIKVKGKSLNKAKLKQLNVKFPSLPEQKRIVEKLDKIFADIDKAKENTEKNLENAKEVFRAQLTEVFNLLKTDGAQDELQNVCAQISAGGDKPAAFSKEPTSRYKIPVYANGEQNDGLLGFTDVPTISQPAITVAARGTIGFACKRMIPYCPIVRLISLIPDTEKISLDFLFYTLKYLIPTGNGTSIPQLTLPTIRKFRISYPTSLDAQAKVVEKLNHLQNTTQELEKTYTKTLSILEELKQSVLQQAFSGKL